MEKVMFRLPMKWFAWFACAILAGPSAVSGAQSSKVDSQTAVDLKLEESDATNSAAGAVRAKDEGPGRERSRHIYYAHKNEEVVFGNDVEVKVGQEINSLMVFGGSALVRGKVTGDTVVFGGNLEVEGEVGGDAAVFLGNLEVRSNAVVTGDAIGFGGKVQIENDSSVRGESHRFNLGLPGIPHWLSSWVKECFFKLRPLAPGVPWVWWAAGVFWVFYLFIALVFRRPVNAGVAELTERPATSFFMGLLTAFLVPVILVILAMVVVGLVVVPFLLAAVLLAALFGKVGVLEWIGIRIGAALRLTFLQRPLVAFLVGSAVVVALYLVPIIGLLTFCFLGVWGLGAAVTAAFGGLKREMPRKPDSSPIPLATRAGLESAPPAASTLAAAPGFVSPAAPAAEPFTQKATSAASSVAGMPPVIPEILGAPYASFWERMGAAFLDVVLVGVISALTGGHLGPLVALAYFAGMWTWKGTTLGGSLMGLKVVRQDGQPITFPVALVRGLAAGLSICVLFLGFFWIAWDRDSQGWHDKIAGTVVLKLPRSVPLICL